LGAAAGADDGGAVWDALMYWRGGEWRVAAMQPSVGGGGGEEEEEEAEEEEDEL
jgi:hypothetical protein